MDRLIILREYHLSIYKDFIRQIEVFENCTEDQGGKKFYKIYLWKINSAKFSKRKNTKLSLSFRENPILKKFPISFEFFLHFLRIREKPYRRRDTDVLKKKAIASPFRPDCLFKEADGSKVVRAEVTSLDEERLGKKEKKRRA